MANGPFMEFLGLYVQESNPRTYTEAVVSTPCSKTEKMAMLIHKIELHHEDVIAIDAQAHGTNIHISRDSQTAVINLDHPDCIYSYGLTVGAGRVQGTLSEYYELFDQSPKVVEYNPPILYARDRIYIGIYGYDSSGASMQKMNCRARIGYTLEKVSEREFIDALVT